MTSRALRPLAAEPGRRDRLHRRRQPRRHEGHVGPPTRDHRSGAALLPGDARDVGSVFTTLYYMRRSYEEGLAAFGWAGERFAAATDYAKMMYEGMRHHYGIEVENFQVHAYAEEDHGAPGRLLAPPRGDHRRSAAADPPGGRARALCRERPHRGVEPVAGRAGGPPLLGDPHPRWTTTRCSDRRTAGSPRRRRRSSSVTRSAPTPTSTTARPDWPTRSPDAASTPTTGSRSCSPTVSSSSRRRPRPAARGDGRARQPAPQSRRAGLHPRRLQGSGARRPPSTFAAACAQTLEQVPGCELDPRARRVRDGDRRERRRPTDRS